MGAFSNPASDREAAQSVRHRSLWATIPSDRTAQTGDRLLYLGDDAGGVPLEVMAVEVTTDELLVIHAMPLRDRYKNEYLEAKKWRV